MKAFERVDQRPAYDEYGKIIFMCQSGGYVMVKRPRNRPFADIGENEMGFNGNSLKISAGDIFGSLTVVAHIGSKNHLRKYLCRCSCGKDFEAFGSYLKRGRVTSCGCSRRTHYLTGTKEYNAWADMHSRCTNPNERSYGNYGGRGISVCDRWKSFENFLADMGEAPDKSMSLDRINNNGNYEPSNCRWADVVTQRNNTRTNRLVSLNGRTETLAVWARITGLPYHVVRKRLNKKWSTEAALTTPLIEKYSHHG